VTLSLGGVVVELKAQIPTTTTTRKKLHMIKIEPTTLAWPMTLMLTYDLDLQFPAILIMTYSHAKVQGQPILKTEWKQMEMTEGGTALPVTLMSSIRTRMQPGIYRVTLDVLKCAFIIILLQWWIKNFHSKQSCTELVNPTLSSQCARPCIITSNLLQLLQSESLAFSALTCLQCFDAVGWVAGRASGL